MRTFSRREFLRLVANGGGALAIGEFLAACGMGAPETTDIIPTQPPAPTHTPVPPTETPEPTVTATQLPPSATATPIPPTSTPAPPDLVVARNGDPETLVRRALAGMGGMEKFVPRGADVVVKPNICVGYRTYEYAATTNPWVVGTLVKMCFEAGAGRVRVMDHTYEDKMLEGYAKSGIREQVEKAGGEMVVMNYRQFVPTDIPQGVELESLYLYDEIVNARVLINVPIAKHHGDAKLTLGIKNLMGVMDRRATMHSGSMGQRLADLSTRVRPTLNVMDAVRMLMAWGPTGGALSDVKQMDTVIVSQDIVALDSYTATLFEMQPSDLEYVVAATKLGVGRSDLANLKIEEIVC
jgi:uncharacterized protein (DUF362 family)